MTPKLAYILEELATALSWLGKVHEGNLVIMLARMMEAKDITTQAQLVDWVLAEEQCPYETRAKTPDGVGAKLKVVGSPVWIQQWWIPVVFEGEDDPEFFKASCLEGFETLCEFRPGKS